MNIKQILLDSVCHKYSFTLAYNVYSISLQHRYLTVNILSPTYLKNINYNYCVES